MAEVRGEVIIDASLERVWGTIGSFDTLGWAGAAKTDVEGEGVGAMRTVYMAGGMVLQEELVALQTHGYSYALCVSPLPVKDYVSTLHAEAVEGGVKVVWSGTFEAVEVPEEDLVAMVTQTYQSCLDEVKRSLEA
ncbi:MAG: SRPBCC family protein [Myxococcota bacterium]